MSATPPPLPKQTLKDDPGTDIKSVAQVLWLYAFFLALPLAIVIAIGSGRKPDAVAIAGLAIFCLLLGFFVLAGVLLMKRKKTGLILTWVLMPFMLLAIPIGTIAGVIILAKLGKPGVRALLK